MCAQRSNGLDTLRATAILLVLMYDYMCFVSREATFGWGGAVARVGVDLFFVRSGYLIGNQVFAGMVNGKNISLQRDLQNSKLSQPESSRALLFQAPGMGWRNTARYGMAFSLFCPWHSLAGRCELVL